MRNRRDFLSWVAAGVALGVPSTSFARGICGRRILQARRCVSAPAQCREISALNTNIHTAYFSNASTTTINLAVCKHLTSDSWIRLFGPPHFIDKHLPMTCEPASIPIDLGPGDTHAVDLSSMGIVVHNAIFYWHGTAALPRVCEPTPGACMTPLTDLYFRYIGNNKWDNYALTIPW